MGRHYLTFEDGRKKNVCDAAWERTRWTFDNFKRVYLSFSGGKDSTVMLHIAAQVAREKGRKLGVLIVDLEGQYKLTIDLLQTMLEEYADVVEPFWVCLPLHLRNGVSMYETHWVCWDKTAQKAWIRKPPHQAITEENLADYPGFPWWHGMEFEEFVPAFGEWYSKQGKTDDTMPVAGKGVPTACMVGIRTGESLNRYRTIAARVKAMYSPDFPEGEAFKGKDGKTQQYPFTVRGEGKGGLKWTTWVRDNVFNIYPIYDFVTQDVWAFQGKNPDLAYNHLYDLMHKAGLGIHQQRICQPYGDDQKRGLWLFHLIEPGTWGRVVARVNGANSGAMYVGQTGGKGNMTGYRSVAKPPGIETWEDFAALLLKTMPPRTKRHFENKIALFIKWWAEHGFPDGIPDEMEYKDETNRLKPSWRRVVKMLLRNDYWAKGLSFTQHKSKVYENYLNLMERRRKDPRFAQAFDQVYAKNTDDGPLTMTVEQQRELGKTASIVEQMDKMEDEGKTHAISSEKGEDTDVSATEINSKIRQEA